MRNAAIIIILFTLLSCNDGTDLGNDYFYLPDYEAVDIGYAYGTMIYKSESKDHFDKIIICSDVKKINFDSKYALILQKPNKKLLIKHLVDDLIIWNNYFIEMKKDSLVDLGHKKMLLRDIHRLVENNEAKKLNTTADSIIDKDVYYQKMFKNKENYYIIQKNKDSIYGPLSVKEFEVIKKKKKIDLDFE